MPELPEVLAQKQELERKLHNCMIKRAALEARLASLQASKSRLDEVTFPCKQVNDVIIFKK